MYSEFDKASTKVVGRQTRVTELNLLCCRVETGVNSTRETKLYKEKIYTTPDVRCKAKET